MTVDRNRMAVALNNSGMCENDLFIILDEMRSLSVRILEENTENLADDVRRDLKIHVDRLKPILNATFRPVGIDSDPFVPRYCASRIEYHSNELGFVVHLMDEKGELPLRPFIGSNHPDTRKTIGYATMAPVSLDDPDAIDADDLKEMALRLARELANEWEIPQKEPHFVENKELDHILCETLAQLEPQPRMSM